MYLFAEDGSEVALSLNQGTQVWDGVGMLFRPLQQIQQRSDLLGQLLQTRGAAAGAGGRARGAHEDVGDGVAGDVVGDGRGVAGQRARDRSTDREPLRQSGRSRRMWCCRLP